MNINKKNKLNNKKIGLRTFVLAIVIIVCTVNYSTAISLAVDAMTTFGSAAYVVEKGDEAFPIGVYIKAGDVIGAYHLEIAYDASKLKYVSGALVDNGGVLVIEGVGGDVSVRNFLYFQAIETGDTSLSFVGAAASNLDGTEMYNVTSLARAPISITGQDDEEEPDEEEVTEPEDEETDDNKEADGEDVDAEDTIEEENSEASEEVVLAETTIAESDADESATAPSVSESAVSINRPEVPDNKPVEGNYDYLLIPFIVILSSVLVIVFVVMLVMNIRRRKYEEALNNDDIKYDFEFETFADDAETITAEEVEERLASAEAEGEDVHTIEIDDIDGDDDI